MPDSPIEPAGGGQYNPSIEVRVSHLEADMRDVKGTLAQMVPVLTRIDVTLTSTLPHLATKAELADLRSELTSAISATRAELVELRSELTSAVSATRADQVSLRSELTSAISATRAELTSAISATRADQANLRSELVAMIAEIRTGLAEKPSKAYQWGVLGVLVAAMVASYGAGLTAIALLR